MRFLDDLKITLPDLPNAKCADPSIPSDVFFPEGRGGLHAVLPMAKKLCDQCPEKIACLQYAVDQEIFDGIWAGTTGQERRWMVRKANKEQHGKKVAPLSANTEPQASSKRSTSSESLR